MGALEKAASLIRSFEGLRLKAYICPAGKVSIGYGTTMINGKPVTMGMVITQEQAEQYMLEDIQYRAKEILKMVNVPLNENNLAALISFVYNEGIEAFHTSTMLNLINRHDFAGAALQFKRWIYIKEDGKMVPSEGLIRRRAIERTMFCS